MSTLQSSRRQTPEAIGPGKGSAEGKRLILEAAVGVARALERGRVVGVRSRWSATLSGLLGCHLSWEGLGGF